jgi:glycosyltransferase involved in cell wall biosynthesis
VKHIVVIGGIAPSLIGFRAPLLAAMVRRGHRVTAMAADGDDRIRAALADLGVAFEEVAFDRAGMDPRRDGRTIAALTGRLRALRPDLILTYTVKPNIYGGLAAQLAGVPRRFAMVTGLGYAFSGQEALRRRLFAGFVRGLYRAGLRGSDGVFFQNPDDQADFDRFGIVPRGSRSLLVNGSGVDVDHFAPVPLPPGPPRFLFVGRMLVEKGFLDYVAAARQVRAAHPEVHFSALGWLDQNPTSVTRADLDAWIREGVIDHLGDVADVRPALAAHHVLILPSYREGTPRSVLEAMAMGRAAVVADAPGSRETVTDGDNGWVVPLRDPAALAAACARYLADPTLVASHGRRGRALAEARYDCRHVADAMLDAMTL